MYTVQLTCHRRVSSTSSDTSTPPKSFQVLIQDGKMPFFTFKKEKSRHERMMAIMSEMCPNIKFSSPKVLCGKNSMFKYFIYLQHANCHWALLAI